MTSCNCDSSDRLERIQQLSERIERLRQEHSEALRTATFIGMTPEEAEAQDHRRQEITNLSQQLLYLQATR